MCLFFPVPPEEVLHLENSVLWEVRAVKGVLLLFENWRIRTDFNKNKRLAVNARKCGMVIIEGENSID